MSVRVQTLAAAWVLSGVLGLTHLPVVTAQGTPTTQGAPDLQALRKRAESGDPEARFNLGRRYSRGEGLPQDDAQAAVWFRKAAVCHAQIDGPRRGVTKWDGKPNLGVSEGF